LEIPSCGFFTLRDIRRQYAYGYYQYPDEFGESHDSSNLLAEANTCPGPTGIGYYRALSCY